MSKNKEKLRVKRAYAIVEINDQACRVHLNQLRLPIQEWSCLVTSKETWVVQLVQKGKTATTILDARRSLYEQGVRPEHETVCLRIERWEEDEKVREREMWCNPLAWCTSFSEQ